VAPSFHRILKVPNVRPPLVDKWMFPSERNLPPIKASHFFHNNTQFLGKVKLKIAIIMLESCFTLGQFLFKFVKISADKKLKFQR